MHRGGERADSGVTGAGFPWWKREVKSRYTQNLPKKFQNNIETIQTQFKMTGKFKRLMKKYFQQRTR